MIPYIRSSEIHSVDPNTVNIPWLSIELTLCSWGALPVAVHWHQNENLDRIAYWLSIGELPGHVFRKAHLAIKYNHEDRVYVGFARSTERYYDYELRRMGVYGLYTIHEL